MRLSPAARGSSRAPASTAALGGGLGVAAARPRSVRRPSVFAPVGRPVAVRDRARDEAEPRSAVDPAIVALVPLAAAGDKAPSPASSRRSMPTWPASPSCVCGGNRDLTEDAVQSAWAIAWSRLGTLRDPERIRAWLLSVTANEARQLLRQQRHWAAVRLEFAEEQMAAPDPYASPAALDMATCWRGSSPRNGPSSDCAMPRASTPPRSARCWACRRPASEAASIGSSIASEWSSNMTEREAFERRLEAAVRGYVEAAPTEIDAARLTDSLATSVPRVRRLVPRPAWRLPSLGFAWILVVAALLAVAGMGLIASGALRDLQLLPLRPRRASHLRHATCRHRLCPPHQRQRPRSLASPRPVGALRATASHKGPVDADRHRAPVELALGRARFQDALKASGYGAQVLLSRDSATEAADVRR